MTKKIILLLVVLVSGATLFSLASTSVLQAQQNNAVSCSLLFVATVHQGPSTGTKLDGTLDFTVDAAGALSGKVTQTNPPEITGEGQVTGRAINLILNLGMNGSGLGQYVFGVGTALDPIQSKTCGNLLGGPFVGPQPGDSGDWVAANMDSNPDGIRNVINSFGYEFPGNVAPANSNNP